jgi:hypothetical protein
LGTDKSTAALGGKWNDDILWFSAASLTGAEIYGRDVIMPGGVSYFQLADTTYKEVIVDTSDVCGGGLYWVNFFNCNPSNTSVRFVLSTELEEIQITSSTLTNHQ